MRVQIREYIEFVKNFTEAANIMTKSFFVIVPYSPAILTVNKSTFVRLPWQKSKVDQAEINRTFEENQSQLEQRISIVQQGLVRCGVRTVQLGTEECIELMYKLFTPGDRSKPIAILQEEAAK